MDTSSGFTKQEVSDFIRTHFSDAGERFHIEELSPSGVALTFHITERSLRPGGTVSGPALMLIADCALYMAILGNNKAGIRAVTTNLSFNFFRKAAGDQNIRAKCKMLKIGKTLATGEVFMYSGDSEDPVAHAVGTFAL